ncbi:MAG: DNA primase [Gallionellales bacterium 35-53-114]|nr:MAG: DNA primase [Gallionellales bacterium 35-53-114]OYZ64263.1 MAG: DNA primase [Gallionellales bacterium 24-53-125]OZB10429.1 MAG: DNA primase [Gallionellales bacterium 39-52-133]HQS57043.1 DNA primase [Gallionellaceae bacterium]HQS75173.1 DNA primase [Gallionellaceae bacterium]
MIPKSFIQDLLNRLDIVDVIERYVPLKKAGANYAACCPFHSEKSPSFTVSQSKQFYHCFGCGAHGTAIGFVMEHAGMGFVDAVEELARSIGVPVPREALAPGQVHQKIAPDLYEVMQAATRYYREQLKQSPRAIDYLKRRGLNGEIAARFGIGYAPEAWQNLNGITSSYQDSSLVETGLVIEGEAGKRYDRFRDRIMFPIVNARGQVIGFGGRILDSGEPKYLNSPETVLFEKGHELYGLFQAQKAIRNNQQVVVVEGYMDVVALAQHGVGYAVATLGTATTAYHVQKLLRLADQVVFCFDGDAAGQRAAWRALENSLPHLVDGKRISFLFLPKEHDPDSYIRENGTESFEQLLHESLPLSGYLLRELSAQVDLRTQEGRSNLLEHAKPLLMAITAPTMALLLRKEVAALAGITQLELEALYGVKAMGAAPRRATQKAGRPAASNLRVLLRCLLFKPDLIRELPQEIADEGADSEAIEALSAWLLAQDGEVSSAVLIQSFQGTAHEPLFAAEQAEIMQWGETFDVDAEFQGVLAKLREETRKRKFEALNARIAGKELKALTEQERLLYSQLYKPG